MSDAIPVDEAKSIVKVACLRVEVDTLRTILAIREDELLRAKGPCSAAQVLGCRLHYAHSGPCDTRGSR